MATARAYRILLLAGALAACSPGEEAPPPPSNPATATPAAVAAVAYACDSGEIVEVRYSAGETAELTYRGQTHAMRAAAAGTGARYVGADMDWRTRNLDGREEAVLSQSGGEGAAPVVLERCLRPAATEPDSPPPASTTADLPPPCAAPALTLALDSADAGAGNRGHTLALTNAGASPCTLNGYPAVRLLDDAGDVLTGVRTEETLGSYFRPGEAPSPVALNPGATGYFDVLSSAIPHGDETGCPRATQMRVTPPGDTAALRLDVELQPCGGRIRVTPVRPVAQP